MRNAHAIGNELSAEDLSVRHAGTLVLLLIGPRRYRRKRRPAQT
jgi:hypothetical protein